MSSPDTKIKFPENLVPDQVRQEGNDAISLYRRMADVIIVFAIVKVEDFNLDAVLSKDFGLDSLDVLDLAMQLDVEFDVSISDEDLVRSEMGDTTVKNIYDLLREKVTAA